MSDSISHLPAHPSLEQLQKRAKELLKQFRAGDSAALQRFRADIQHVRESPSSQDVTLADAQFTIAREHGFESWAKLKHYIGTLVPLRLMQLEELSHELAEAHVAADPAAVRAINAKYGTGFVADFHDSLMMQQRLTTWFASESRTPELALADARQMVAHFYEFEDWGSFVETSRKADTGTAAARSGSGGRVPFYQIDWEEQKLSVKGPQSEKDWEAIFAAMEEHGLTAFDAPGLDDPAVKGLAKLHRVTRITVNSSTLSDDGLKQLAAMPQLLELDISGPQITDRGLTVLRHLTNLRRFKACWTQGISDMGAANLTSCDRLESVNLMGTPTGDGLIRTLGEKPNLRQLKTGREVTDAGIKLLHSIPAFKRWQGEEIRYELVSAEAEPNHLMIDGPFTDAGIADLVGLDGLFGLSFFWHSRAFTSAGLAPLRSLRRLGFLGCPGASCDDQAMRQIAALPALKMLVAQGAVASDDGWASLAKSRSLEHIWGRQCPNFTGRGLVALAGLPTLQGIAISCKQVDDAALSTLPRFPALRHIVPMDLRDEAFLHLGRCQDLERLWCMYCRDTTDVATEHIARLSQLKTYYAGMTQIGDRSLALLSGVRSLERIELWACPKITDSGVTQLAILPQLRHLIISGSPSVSPAVLRAFPAHVRLKYSP